MENQRESFRQKCVEEIPGWYNPFFHLLIPSLFGIGIVTIAVVLIENLRWYELFAVPLTYAFANLIEWTAHRDLLHTRHRMAPVLYDRHTPVHHRIYIMEDMALRNPREFRLILIPAYAILLVFLITLPVTLSLLWFVGRNWAALFAATSIAYVVGYEWLHLSYHLPENHPIGRMSLIKKLRKHHAVHHDPRLMQQWNLNVTIPLWDWILGTRTDSAQPYKD